MARCENPIGARHVGVSRGGFERPCGRCAACLARKVSNWSFRLMQEDKVSLTSYFITLTYGCENVPISKNGFMDLSKRDLQLFWKRLRRWHDRYGKLRLPLKYYAVGEYGGKFKRPHFHAIVFNCELESLIGAKYAGAADRGTIKLDGASPYDCPHWDLGHITVGQVSGASVGYTMKYMSKPWHPMHRNDDRTPQFSLMSKGLGISYLTKAMRAWHLADLENRQYVNLEGGKKASLPRYYKDRLLTLQQKENLRAWNLLESMKPKEWENTSTQRSEALYAGKRRYDLSILKNQKL